MSDPGPAPTTAPAPPDLLALTAELIEIPSPSFAEAALADRLEADLRRVPWLDVHRIDDEVVARTNLGCPQRLVLAGHTDTVPAAGNERAVVDGDRLSGLGAADMKGGLAAMLAVATTVEHLAVDLTFVFYTAEEVAAEHSGLAKLFEQVPDLVRGDAAILGEPTSGEVEAGCQGMLRLTVELTGTRAHTARPWMGANAIHRLGEVLRRLDAYEARRPVLDDCEYREALQAVLVDGGVAGNVVPDRAVVTLNHRFAPDRRVDEAEAHVRSLFDGVEGIGEIARLDAAPAAPPSLTHPLLRPLVDRHRLPVRAKLGWTDVARFAAHGIPATNLGPGDSEMAHRPDEFVARDQLERVWRVLVDLVTVGPGPADGGPASTG